MGCSSAQEKLEEEIINMNINKIEIQMKKYQQMKLLGKDINSLESNQNKNINSTNSIKNNANKK